MAELAVCKIFPLPGTVVYYYIGTELFCNVSFRFRYPSQNRSLERVIPTAGSPVSLALDYLKDHVYWIQYSLDNTLSRCNLDGTNVVVVSTPLQDTFVIRLDVTSRY